MISFGPYQTLKKKKVNNVYVMKVKL